jgi:hypothetical protein
MYRSGVPDLFVSASPNDANVPKKSQDTTDMRSLASPQGDACPRLGTPGIDDSLSLFFLSLCFSISLPLSLFSSVPIASCVLVFASLSTSFYVYLFSFLFITFFLPIASCVLVLASLSCSLTTTFGWNSSRWWGLQ